MVVGSCGSSPSVYTGHPFCIGAATAAAERGIPPTTIQRLGRWSSSAFESYIRSDDQVVHDVQLALSRIQGKLQRLVVVVTFHSLCEVEAPVTVHGVPTASVIICAIVGNPSLYAMCHV